MGMMNVNAETYSPIREARRILRLLTTEYELKLPQGVINDDEIQLTSEQETIYFPIPFKETETTAALKALEASLASQLARLRYGPTFSGKVQIKLEKVAGFLFSTYLATIDGFSKFDSEAKKRLKDTDLLQAQS